MTTKTQHNGTVTPEQRLAIVRHLANGRGIDFTATAMNLRASVIREIGHEHGWPREESLVKAADVLQRNLDQQAKDSITPRPDLEADQARRDRQARAESPVRQSPPPAPRPDTPAPRLVDPTADLLRRGKASPKKRTQQLAQRIGQDIERLRDAITADERRAREQAEKEAERKAALEEVRKAEEALREAREKLRRHKNHPGGNGRATTSRAPSSDSRRPGGTAAGGPASAARAAAGLVTTDELAARGLTSKTLRAWAADNQVDCPAAGRVPRRVLDAYDAAQPTQQRSVTA